MCIRDEFDSLRQYIRLVRARELNRMKEAADYAGPPIAARCQRRRQLRLNRSSESKFKCNEESRWSTHAYANTRRFCVCPEKPLPSKIIIDDRSPIFACVEKYRITLPSVKCQFQMSLTTRFFYRKFTQIEEKKCRW